MRTYLALVCAALIGCGDDGGGSNTNDANNGPDAKQFLDAPPTMNAMVTISGRAIRQTTTGATAEAGVLIEAFRNANESAPIASTTTTSTGNYSLTIQTMGESIDGFLKATKTGLKTTYLYPPYPIGMDFAMATVVMVDQGGWDGLQAATQVTQQDGKALVALVVTDGTNPVAGAMASSDPTTPDVHYNDIAGTIVFPSSQATMTYTDGIAYLFNLPADKITVSATKTGMTFSSHSVKGWADELTTTVIVP